MLEKNIDHIIYGLNYYSYFLGINQLNAGKSALLIDDERTNFSSFFLNSCSEIDRAFFLRMGERYGIGPFKRVDTFLTMTPQYFQLGHTVLRLGDSPFRNFCELTRRFHFAFGNKNEELSVWLARHQLDSVLFNKHFDDFLHQLVEQVVGVKGNKSVDFSLFYHLAPAFFREIYDSLSDFFFQSEDTSTESWALRSLLSSCRALSQDKLSLKFGKFELFHLLTYLLSPHYSVSCDDFNKQLEAQFLNAGGNVRRVQLAEWLYDAGKPWAINLSSFEGIVMPKGQSILGNIHPTFPLEVETEDRFHSSLVFEWKINENFSSLLPEGRYIFAYPDRLGTDSSFFAYSRNGMQVSLRVFYLYLPANKKEFIANDLRKQIINQLFANFSFDVSWIESESIYEGDDYVLDTDPEHGAFSQSVAQTPYLLNNGDLNNKELVKFVDYYGVFRHFPLGKFSLALDLCPLD